MYDVSHFPLSDFCVFPNVCQLGTFAVQQTLLRRKKERKKRRGVLARSNWYEMMQTVCFFWCWGRYSVFLTPLRFTENPQLQRKHTCLASVATVTTNQNRSLCSLLFAFYRSRSYTCYQACTKQRHSEVESETREPVLDQNTTDDVFSWNHDRHNNETRDKDRQAYKV